MTGEFNFDGDPDEARNDPFLPDPRDPVAPFAGASPIHGWALLAAVANR